MGKVDNPSNLKVKKGVSFSLELFDKILSEVANGKALINVLKEESMPSRTEFYNWLKEDNSLVDKYARACDERAEKIFEEILEISDDSSNDTVTKTGRDGELYEEENREWVNRSKLRVDARKWVLSKMQPKKYGDKMEVDHNIKQEQPLFGDE